MQSEVTRTPAEEDHRAENTIINLLLGDPVGPWSVDELARELKSHVVAVDSVASLQAAGLIHLCGELVFPTRATIRASQFDY